jgi:hypothetical protein
MAFGVTVFDRQVAALDIAGIDVNNGNAESLSAVEDRARTSYRRDFWDQQPHRVQVWSEKGTVRGLAPVLDNYAVGFNPVHGFTSATSAHDAPRMTTAAI